MRGVKPLSTLSPIAPTLPQSPRQIVTVVHRLSGWKLLTWLALTGPSSLEIDEFPSADVAHTNIVAGLISDDGRTVLARLPQAEVEIESLSAPPLPPELFFSKSKDVQQEFTLVRADGTKVAAKFVGLDATTGLSLLEAAETLSMSAPLAGDEGSTDTPTVGQRVRLFAPAQAPVPPTVARKGVSGDEGVIYLNMGEAQGLLTDVQRAPSGKVTQATARASLSSPAWTGAIATNSSGAPLGIVAQSGADDTRIVPIEALRGATTRVLARHASVQQPWLGARGDAASRLPLAYWVERGWKSDLATAFLQKQQGVFLTSVIPTTPAALAGLRPGDVITNVNAREVRSNEDLSAMLRDSGVGSMVDVTVRRAFENAPLKFSFKLSGSQNPALETADAELSALRAELFKVKADLRAFQGQARGGQGNVNPLTGETPAAAMDKKLRDAERKFADTQQRFNEAAMRVAQARAQLFNGSPAVAINVKPLAGHYFASPWQSIGLEVVGLLPRSAAHFGAQRGVLILAVRSGSPSALNGLRAGDVIESDNNLPFDLMPLRRLLRGETDEPLQLGVIRAGQRVAIKFSLSKTP